MTHPSEPSRTVHRRTIARGMAWATPVIVATAAAPAIAASPTDCGSCVIPVASVAATVMERGLLSSTGTVTVAAPFTFNVTGCTGLISLQAVTVSQAVLTMRVGPSTTTHTITTGLDLGVGVLGQVVTVDALAFTGVTLPTGIYAGVGSIGNLPASPTTICFTMHYVLTIGGTPTACSQVVCFSSSLVSAAVGVMPGVVTLATAWTPVLG